MKNYKKIKVEELSTLETREIEGGRILPIGPPILLPVLKKIWDWATS
jgi:hypothetical protein